MPSVSDFLFPLSSFRHLFGRKEKTPAQLAELSAAAGPFGDTSQVGRLGRLQVGAEAKRSDLESFLTPFYKSMATGPGYSPEEQNTVLQESLGGIGGTYTSLRDRLTNRVARTRNAAGFNSTMLEAGRSEARDRASAGRQAQIAFADEKARRNELGAKGLAQLFGVDTSFLTNLLAQSTAIQGAREGKKIGSADILSFLGKIAQGAAAGAAGGG